MNVGAGRPWLGVAGFALLLSLGLSSASWAQSDELSVLDAQVIKLYQAGKYSDASSVAERALALSEQLYGPSHPNVAVALNDLAELYRAEGRYADAEPITRRALAIRETALGRDDPGVAQSLNLLAELCRAQGRYAEAEPLLKRALAIYESAFGPDSLDVAPSLNNLALLYQGEGRYAEAEPLYRRALAIMEKTLGPEHSDVAQALNNLADLYREEGHYAEGKSLLKRALAIREGAFGPDHPVVAESLTTLAALYDAEGRYADTEPLLKRALAIDEKALGPDHPDIASLLNDLAEVYRVEERVAEAVPLYERALAIREKVLGADHPDLATNINNLALAYVAERRYADAETLYKRALAIDEKALGADHPVVAVLLNNMADPYIAEKRYADAEALLKRALAIHEKALGPDHPDVATDLNSLAVLDHARQRYPESGASLNRVLAIREKALGPDHPEVAIALDNLAWLASTQQDWIQAAAYWRRSTGILIRRAERGAVGRSQGEKGKGEAERLSWQGRSLVKSAYHIAAAQQEAEPRLAADMFESAQWAQSSEAAQSLAQMAVRGASGKPQLAALVRERQDLLAEWQRGDAARTAAASQPPEKRNKEAEAANTARLSAIDTRIAEIDQELGKDFPDYAALVSPKAMSLADVQGQLGEDEALILFLDTPDWKPTPEETFIWVVSKTESRWVRTDIGTKGLQDRVVALRCGLDYDGSWDVSGSRCAELLETTYSEADHQNGKPLPFDLGRAYALYTALFGRVGDLIKDKHLLIVPSGALTQLPFQVLVTEQPNPSLIGAEALRQAKWLIRGHAVTVLPSVSSLKALRQLAKESRRQPRPDRVWQSAARWVTRQLSQ